MIRSIVFCSIWLLLLTAYYVTLGGVVALALLTLSAVVIVYSAISVKRAAKAIRVNIDCVNPAIKGEFTDYRVVIDGSGRFTTVTAQIQLTITHTATNVTQQQTVVINLNERQIIVPIQHDYCGHYEVAVKRVICTDMLQLFTLNANVQSSVETVVLPLSTQPFLQMPQAYEQQGEQAYASTQLHEDGEERAQLKVYSPGDQVKKIHWKLSSKLDELYVQQYANLQQPQFIVALDCSEVAQNVALYDALMEKLAAALKGDDVKFMHNDGTVVVTNELQSIQLMRDVLQQPIQQLTFTSAQRQQLQQQYPNMFVITADNSGLSMMEQLIRSETA